MEKMSAVGYSNAEQANKDMEEWLAKSQKERERKEELVTAFKEGGLEHLKELERQMEKEMAEKDLSQDRINSTSDTGPERSVKRLITRQTAALRKISARTVAKLKNARRAYIGLAIVLLVYEVMGSFYGREACYRRPQDQRKAWIGSGGTNGWINHCWFETYAVSLMLCPLAGICYSIFTVLNDWNWRVSIQKACSSWNRCNESSWSGIVLMILYLLFFLSSKSI
jgi:G:T-mismatch repair DNA endonuclease (very short patch repair protein)